MRRGKPPSCPAPFTFSLQGPSHKLLPVTYSLAELHPSEKEPSSSAEQLRGWCHTRV